MGADAEALVGAENNPLKQTATALLPQFTDTLYLWELKSNGGDFQSIEFSQTASGQLKHTLDTMGKKNAFLFGDVMRLNQINSTN